MSNYDFAELIRRVEEELRQSLIRLEAARAKTDKLQAEIDELRRQHERPGSSE